ncbi:MAG: o-succinylbenzoate--CoA ligase, partial [Candidatus Zixiibacteriota bacterium]
VTPGDKVALLGPNSLEYVVAFWAVLRLNAVACPLSTRWPETMVHDTACRIGITLLIQLTGAANMNIGDTTVIPSAKLFGKAGSATVTTHRVHLNQPVSIVFTSGSSGLPKAALHSLGNHIAGAEGVNKRLRFTAGDSWLLSLPLYHVGGLAILFRAALAGATVAIPEQKQSIVEAVRALDVSHLSLVPTQLRRLLRDADAAHSIGKQVKAILMGGAPLPERLVREVQEYALPLVNSYGLTEMTATVTCTSLNSEAGDLSTCGRPLAGRELRIVEGEVHVRGDTLFAGYVENDSVRCPLRNGWFPTGDMGELDADGNLRIHGRRDNMFISGGENIHPETIEAALLQLPDVTEAVVVRRPDKEYGHRPVAFVRLEPSAELEPDRLRAELRDRLPGFMVPDEILPWPKDTPIGMKIDRPRWQELADKLLSWTD